MRNLPGNIIEMCDINVEVVNFAISIVPCASFGEQVILSLNSPISKQLYTVGPICI